MPKLSELALRPDLQIGPLLVSPSRRLVEGPGGGGRPKRESKVDEEWS